MSSLSKTKLPKVIKDLNDPSFWKPNEDELEFLKKAVSENENGLRKRVLEIQAK
jgi:hypothetical protein